MQPEHTGEVRHHKPRHLAERFENMLGLLMVVAVVLLAIGLAYGVLTAGPSEPSWMR